MSKDEAKCTSTKEVYRLHFLKLEQKKIKKGKFVDEFRDFPFIKFVAPENMTQSDVFQVVSFISQKIDENQNYLGSLLSNVKATDEMLNTFHFMRLHDAQQDDCTEIFTVEGNQECFKRCKYNGKWKAWFSPDVKEEEVEAIYAKCNLKMPKFEAEKGREF